MSAIAGIYHLTDEPMNLNHGKIMMKALEQFPAHDIQTWNTQNIFLGCNHQWITPESIDEQLPFYDRTRQLAITADAMIDNREELFEKLQIGNSRKKTIADSELILLAYDKWGEESPKYLVGDFAYMIWDEKNQKLFGARDFSGGRTIYYFYSHNRFAFCTTIQPLLKLPYIEKKLNEQWLAEFLAITGMVDTADVSITPYLGIYQLPPSNSMSISDGKLFFKRYCTPIPREKTKFKTNDEYVEAFREVFQKAVHSRLRSYRQVGAQLSGGLDSGSIVSIAAKSLAVDRKQLNTYSYVPPSDFPDFTANHYLADETPFIKETVKFVGNINDHYCDFKGKDSFSEIDRFLDVIEMPYKFFENSFWLKGMFEKAMEDDVGILLNGGRGNLSISWGNAEIYYAHLLKRLKWLQLTNEIRLYSKNLGVKRSHVFNYVGRLAFPFVDQRFHKGPSYQLPPLISQELAEKTDVFARLKQFGIGESGWFLSGNIYEQRISHFHELFHWNASNTLAAKLSLPFSLWKRDPTNDLRVIRYCLSIPEEQYVQDGLGRALIRRATKTDLPEKIRLNQRIQGVQGADWVYRMTPHWNVFINELQQTAAAKSIFAFINEEVFRTALHTAQENGPRPENATNPHYKILMRTIIVKRFIEKMF